MSAPTSNGGKPQVKPLSYSPPRGGPGGQGHSDNYGNGSQPNCRGPESGSPGIGGTNHGNSGSQGK